MNERAPVADGPRRLLVNGSQHCPDALPDYGHVICKHTKPTYGSPVAKDTSDRAASRCACDAVRRD